ncbi:hypothetical protein [Aureimonas sp. AU20]|uniref:hypothetical protein n=1 Tax=Aureimonas sp. AU20 TaxID=1349819 RepID=UPI000720BD9F|nr:hypothetical protein [Aureimonas sp. AU20]ALN72883.1 hypothetical protein M673_09155 [Aureimonas sp. AU20]
MTRVRLQSRSHHTRFGLAARLLVLGLLLALGLTLAGGVPSAEAAMSSAAPCDHAAMGLSGKHGQRGKAPEGGHHGDLCCLFHCVPIAPFALVGAPPVARTSEALPLTLSVLAQGVTPTVRTPPPRAV